MESDQARQFVSLLMANQQRIYAFILSMIPNWSDADDLMQETAEVMWVKFENAYPIADFSAWAICIARNKIMNFYAKKRREHVLFSDTLFDDIAQRAQRVSESTDIRLETLQYCLRKLTERDRQLIQKLYEKDITIKALAKQVGRPIHGFYKAVGRIHNALLQCIRRSLALEDTI